jgi:hypothetical protein
VIPSLWRKSKVHSHPPKNGRILGLFRAEDRAERLSAYDVLAEGQELWSNIPLSYFSIGWYNTQSGEFV